MTVLLLLYLVLPAVVIYSCGRVAVLNNIGVVVLCYIVGIAIAQLLAMLSNLGLSVIVDNNLQELLMGFCIMFAMPMLLFSTNVRDWLRLGPTTMVSISSSVFAVVSMSFIAGLLLNDQIVDMWKLVGMSVALYLGGTPTLAATKEALQVDTDFFLQIHSYDTVLTLSYVVFMVSIAQRLFNRFLPAFSSSGVNESQSGLADDGIEDIHKYKQLISLSIWQQMLPAVILCLIILAVVVGSSYAIFNQANMAMIMVGLTVLAVAASFNDGIRQLPNTFEVGMYVVLVFCVVVGSLITPDLFAAMSLPLVAFILFVVFGSLIIHLAIAKLFKIDSDTTIITSVALICSPPFIPMVVVALKNKDMLLSGITAGVLGYVLGNVLGVVIAYSFKALMG
jgi:uncharacterized membrane protein